ncbi:YlaH-like protein [Scopulibacillus darangshiensis]|uniref:YlaH-like protein n=1 Tax=Scopulibacillus darangshiensis TaxID=442528 RepID=A0A4R2P6N2_9BACL|nr:YlaH-like protein [Scopulibacillus darangshiensis]
MNGKTAFDFSPYPQWLLDNPITSDYMFVILYATIVVLSIVVYKLGFAKKLPILKSAVIYILLLVGCLILAILALQLPIVGSLFFAALVLVIYKIRLNASKKRSNNKEA